MLTREDRVKLGVPPALRDRYVVRSTDATFQLSKKENPMIVIDWEICGRPNSSGGVDTEIDRQGSKWQIAGLSCNRTYHTLIAGPAWTRFLDFCDAAGVELPEPFDESNPDVTPFKGLVMEALLATEQTYARMEATDEDRAQGKLGEFILDKDGNKIATTRISITQFLSRFDGEVTPF